MFSELRALIKSSLRPSGEKRQLHRRQQQRGECVSLTANGGLLPCGRPAGPAQPSLPRHKTEPTKSTTVMDPVVNDMGGSRQPSQLGLELTEQQDLRTPVEPVERKRGCPRLDAPFRTTRSSRSSARAGWVSSTKLKTSSSSEVLPSNCSRNNCPRKHMRWRSWNGKLRQPQR